MADKKGRTAKEIAAAAGVSVRTLQRNALFAQDVNTLEAAIPGMLAAILDGPVRYPHDLVEYAASLCVLGYTEDARGWITPAGRTRWQKIKASERRHGDALAMAKKLVALAGGREAAALLCLDVPEQ